MTAGNCLRNFDKTKAYNGQQFLDLTDSYSYFHSQLNLWKFCFLSVSCGLKMLLVNEVIDREKCLLFHSSLSGKSLNSQVEQ